MKKLVLAVAAAVALLAAHADSPVLAGQNYPDPCNAKVSGSPKVSPLCNGLIEHWGFQEASDTIRYGSFGTRLLEVDAKNVANAGSEIVAGLDGTVSLDLEANDLAWLWQLGGLPVGSSAIAAWVKPESLPGSIGGTMTIVSSNTTNIQGPELYVETTSTAPVNGKVCFTNYEQETDTQLTVCSTNGSVAAGGAFHVVAGESPHHTGKSRLYLSFSGAAFVTTAASYWTKSGIPPTDVGAHRSKLMNATFSQHFDGMLDQLLIYGRPLTLAEVSLLYNSGTAQPYPFGTDN